MSEGSSRRAVLGAIVVRNQTSSVTSSDDQTHIDEEVHALHELIQEDLGIDLCTSLQIYYSWGQWYTGFRGPFAAFFVDGEEWCIGVPLGVDLIYLVHLPSSDSFGVMLLGPGMNRPLREGLVDAIYQWRKRRRLLFRD